MTSTMYNYVKAKVNIARIGYAINSLTGSALAGSQSDDQQSQAGTQSNTVTMDTDVATIRMTGSVGADDAESDSSEDLSDLEGVPQQKRRVMSLPIKKATDSNQTSSMRRESSISPGGTRENPFNRETPPTEETLFPQLSDPGISLSPTGLSSSLSDSWAEISTQGTTPEDPINLELGLTENHFALPDGAFGNATQSEIESVIDHCKLLILESPEHSERRKNLVNKLVQLRLRMSEMKAEPEEQEPDSKVVMGHTFSKRESNARHYCETCCTVIWGLLTEWYCCQGCGYNTHAGCLNDIKRSCALVKIQKSPEYIMAICQEKGLAYQDNRCAECRKPIAYCFTSTNNNASSIPRQCDYTGNFYCEACHWNDTMIMPARLLHNWDIEPRKVCRASKQVLRLLYNRAIIRVQDINPMLFNYVEELNQVKKLREEILIMKKYFLSCQDALSSKLLLQLKERQHFVENSDMYSLRDLSDIVSDVLLPELVKIHSSFAQHIKTDCQRCAAKGFVCEMCDQTEVLFPFDNIAVVCSQCSTVLHRHCYVKKNNQCPKCKRINERKTSTTVAPPKLSGDL